VALYAVFAYLVAIAIALVFAGWRGRRIDDHPICPTCGYDLFGVAPGRCPECGRSLGSWRGIRSGNRRRSPALALAGAMLLVGSLTLAGLRAYNDVKSTDWRSVKPVWWLKAEARSGSLTTANDALAELRRRVDDGRLDVAHRRNLVQLALDLHADRTTPWNPGWGDLVMMAHESGELTEPEFDAFLRGLPGASVQASSRVPVGGLITFNVGLNMRRWRTFDRAWPSVEPNLALASVTINGRTWTLAELMDEARTSRRGIGVPVDFPSGRYALTVRLRVWLHLRENPTSAVYHFPDPPDMEWFEVHTLEVEVLSEPKRDE